MKTSELIGWLVLGIIEVLTFVGVYWMGVHRGRIQAYDRVGKMMDEGWRGVINHIGAKQTKRVIVDKLTELK